MSNMHLKESETSFDDFMSSCSKVKSLSYFRNFEHYIAYYAFVIEELGIYLVVTTPDDGDKILSISFSNNFDMGKPLAILDTSKVFDDLLKDLQEFLCFHLDLL